MSHVLLDTHAWAWSLTASERLSDKALAALQAAETVSVSAISFYEIGQKVRLGKWPEMAPHVVRLFDIADQQGVRLIDVSSKMSLSAAILPWEHRDPFDRLILATALDLGWPIVSADTIFDELAGPGWPGRIW